MAQSVSLWGATYSDVPAIEVPKSGGGMASFTDVTDTTAIASDVLSGKYFYTAAGEKTLGTGSGGGGGSVTQDQDGYIVLPSTGGGGGGATQHVIHLEFSDSTDADINVYYNDSLIGAMITAYEPSTWTYSSKTVVIADLDGVEWYNKTATWTTLFDDNVTINSGSPNYISISSFNENIGAGELWRVTFDGVEWTLTPEYSNQLSNYGIGNGTFVDGSQNPTCPFFAYKGGATTLLIGTTHAVGIIPLKIEKQV